MLKLLIAEDEKLERDAIHFLIKKHFPNTFISISEAKNGQEAVDIAIKENPDLIFMDIQMPLKNGLDAAQEIREKRPHISFIILTAFGTFDYAKKAIKIPVKDYLLKPISVEDLKLSVNKAIRGIYEEQEKSNHLVRLEEQMKSFKPLIHKNLIHQIITGSKTPYSDVDYFHVYDLNYNHYFCLIIQVDQVSKSLDHCFTYINKKLSFAYKDVVSECHLMKMIFFVFSDETIHLRDMKLEVQQALISQGIPHYRLGLSSVKKPITELDDSYREAETDLATTQSAAAMNSLAVAEITLYDAIINEDISQGLELMDSLLNELSGLAIETREIALEKVLQGLCKKISFYINEPFKHTLGIVMPSAITSTDDIYLLQQHLHDILLRIITCIQNYRGSGEEKIVQSAITYINKNFTNYDISLNGVADVIHISPFYLSKIFKEVTGKNFKQHLIERRMEYAKDLLKHHSVKDVCNMIGYSDPNYFSRAFKKFTGLSPKKFSS